MTYHLFQIIYILEINVFMMIINEDIFFFYNGTLIL